MEFAPPGEPTVVEGAPQLVSDVDVAEARFAKRRAKMFGRQREFCGA